MKLAVIADDATDVLEFVKIGIENLGGYTVRAYPNGTEAIAGLKGAMAEGEKIDFLLTDLQMPPGPDGIAVARCARILFPTCKRILMSGNTGQIPVEWAESVDRILEKPFSSEDLKKILNENKGCQSENAPAPTLVAHGFGKVNL